MATIIKSGSLATDNWRRLDPAGALEASIAAGAPLLVALADWLDLRERLLASGLPLGVALDGHDDPNPLLADLTTLALIAIRIPKFTDGRGYSLARLLRSRHGYRGELRATGDVLHDQLFYLKRCGFDAFELRADQDPQAALTAFAPFSAAYQASADQVHPLFRRRSESILHAGTPEARSPLTAIEAQP